MSSVNTARRYYLGQRQDANFMNEEALACTWRWKQEQQPGTVLPDDFPMRAELTAVGYATVEDLNGADSQELQVCVQLSARDAHIVLTSLRKLLTPTIMSA
jgi:hypothetical protein